MLDERTPVLIGAGQVSERPGEPGYRQRRPADLAADAARAALADAGVEARAIDTVAAVPQFEISLPWAVPLLGASDNFPRSVATRLGAEPRRAVLEVGGGQAPQHLVNEFAAANANGNRAIKPNRIVIVPAASAVVADTCAKSNDCPLTSLGLDRMIGFSTMM